MDYDLWFTLLKIKPSVKRSIIAKYKNTEIIYNNKECLKESSFIRKEDINRFYGDEFYDTVCREKEQMDKKGVKLVTLQNPIYKQYINEMIEAPFGLFYKGDLNCINTYAVGIVGARNCSDYAIAATKALAKELASDGITIVSGGAKGVDSIAHKTAEECGGKNICILGSGLDVPYPKQNTGLFKEIEKNGILISEYPLKTPPLKYNFPMRNRIISGFSKFLIVTEASQRSGSLKTVEYAKNTNKSILAVPGSMFYEGCRGSNELILKKEADLCLGAEHLREVLEMNHDIKIKPYVQSPEKRNILKYLSDIPIHMDEILKKSGYDRGRLYALLFEMQVKNEIVCLPGNYYVKIS